MRRDSDPRMVIVYLMLSALFVLFSSYGSG
jgi:hypothetical protein